jgi:tryptophan-rich sensory protein
MINWLDKRSLIQLCILVLLVTGAINGWIASMNIEGVTAQKMHQSDQFFPAPYVIGTVWTLLMLSLAFCFKKLKGHRCYQKGVLFLFLICVAYPIYTIGFSSLGLMIAGNLITIVMASFLSGILFEKFKSLAGIVLLIPTWVVFVTYLMFFIH